MKLAFSSPIEFGSSLDQVLITLMMKSRGNALKKYSKDWNSKHKVPPNSYIWPILNFSLKHCTKLINKA